MERERPYRIVIAIAIRLLRLMRWDLHTSGLEHVPREGPAVLAANHIGFGDFVFIGRAALYRGRLTRFMAKKEAFDHWLTGPILRSMHHIPVDRFGARPEDAIAPAVEALRRGEVVGIHPEGTISRSFVPATGKTGAARIAAASGAPLVPVAIWGSHRILTAGHVRGLLRRHIDVMVRFGPPIELEPGEPPAAVTARLMDRIREMVAEEVADYPQRPSGPGDRWWVPASLGGTAPTVEESARLTEQFRARARARAAWRRLQQLRPRRR